MRLSLRPLRSLRFPLGKTNAAKYAKAAKNTRSLTNNYSTISGVALSKAFV